MSLTISQFKKRIENKFSDIQQIDDSVIRIIKKAKGLPFAVCYFDVGEKLPETREELTQYQDRIIGSSYFQGRKSLQWSNYLYFVTNKNRLLNNKVRQAKELIENDRNYARKFVVSEDDIDSILTPIIITPKEDTPHTSILSIWTERLVNAGLGDAILSDESLPARLKLIETSFTDPASKRQPSRHKLEEVKIENVPFIQSLELKEYLDYPVQRKFQFGIVNLVVGANGSGKTSLLEAIELFYCGKNNRNPKNPPRSYKLAVHFVNGKSEVVSNSRMLQELRDRNLIWYGQLDVKTNNLYQSFAQFNFLDTDAAVSLADSTSHIEDDLSKLLVGPDASKTWRNIERVHEAVYAKLRELRPRKEEIKEEIEILEKQIQAAKSIPRESDSIQTRLEQIINQLGWEVNKDPKETLSGKLIEPLSEFLSLVQQAMTFNWIESPVVINGLIKYCHEARGICEKVEINIKELETFQRRQNHLVEVIKHAREALKLANQVKRLIDADVVDRFAECSKMEKNIETHSIWLAGVDEKALDILLATDLKVSVDECYKSAVKGQSLAKALLTNKKSEYKNYSKLRDQSLNFAQELRQIATKILQENNKPDECPLCHTQFEPGDLINRINVGLDEHLERSGQKLLNNLQEQEDEVRKNSAVVSALEWLIKFCGRIHIGVEISVLSILEKVESIKQKNNTAQTNLKSLNRELLELEAQGLSMAKLEETSSLLHELGYPLVELSREAMDKLLTKIDNKIISSLKTLEPVQEQSIELQRKIEEALGLTKKCDLQELKNVASQLKEQLISTESLKSKLFNFLITFPWPYGKPLAEMKIEAESVRKVAVGLQTALGKEQQADTSHTDSIKRKEHLEPKLIKLCQRIKRFDGALIVLGDLKKTYSLESAMKSALQQNRVVIENIFSRIHSPAEFKGLGSSWNTLIRKDGTESNLNQISTGQRAAFALSIFLSQNTQLKVAPPVILIDDPIAHIDDLNSLSFLDYLREIALTGKRQIFFATADSKLATLFERKFDFLGENNFQRFDLRRKIYSVK